MKIAIGSDHRGFELKQDIIKLLEDAAFQYKDCGCYDGDSVDYPDIAKNVAQAVASGAFDRGILICSTGIGMSIAANKIKGIRAALCCDGFNAARSRMHNDANILCMGADTAADDYKEIVTTFLKTEFEGGRHKRRLEKIKAMEGLDEHI